MDEHRAPALAGARQVTREISGDECVEAVRHALQCEGAAVLQLGDGAFEIAHVYSSWFRSHMERGFVHAKRAHFLQNRRIFRRRCVLKSGKPGEDERVGQIEQMLEFVELRIVETRQRRIGETAHEQVHLAYATMPGAESDAAAADLAVHLRGTVGHMNPCAPASPWRRLYGRARAGRHPLRSFQTGVSRTGSRSRG